MNENITKYMLLSGILSIVCFILGKIILYYPDLSFLVIIAFPLFLLDCIYLYKFAISISQEIYAKDNI